MKNLKLGLLLLLSYFLAPVAMADEIGGGSPETTSAATTQALSAEPETALTSWWEEFLSWFK